MIELSRKAKVELGFIMWAGILKAIEKGELDKEVLQEMVDFYSETYLISAKHLQELLK